MRTLERESVRTLERESVRTLERDKRYSVGARNERHVILQTESNIKI